MWNIPRHSLNYPWQLAKCVIKVYDGHHVGSRGCKGGRDDENSERHDDHKGEEGEDIANLDRERCLFFFIYIYNDQNCV